MKRYFTLSMLLLASLLFASGCNTAKTDVPPGGDAGGADAAGSTDGDASPEASPAGVTKESADESAVETPGADESDAGGGTGADGEATTTDGKKSVLGALGRALKRGAAEAAGDK